MAKTGKHPSNHLVQWGDLDFHVKPRDIIGVKGLSITGACETEEKEAGGEKYATFKASKGIEFSMTAVLNAYLTDDVQKKALRMVKLATKGEKNYLYMGKGKLFPSKFMLVSAKPDDITIAAGGKWVSCEVALSFKQASKYDGSEAPASSGGKGGKGGRKKATARNTGTPAATGPGQGIITTEQKAAIRKANQQTTAAKKQAATSLGVKVNSRRQTGGAGGKWVNEYR